MDMNTLLLSRTETILLVELAWGFVVTTDSFAHHRIKILLRLLPPEDGGLGSLKVFAVLGHLSQSSDILCDTERNQLHVFACSVHPSSVFNRPCTSGPQSRILSMLKGI